MPPCSRAARQRLATCSGDGDEPFWSYASKIGSRMPLERGRRIQHTRASLLAHEDHPMPIGPSPIAVPFDGQKRPRGQCRPGHETRLSRTRPQSVPVEQAADMVRARPEAGIRSDNSQAPRRPLCRAIAYSRERRHTGDAAASPLQLYDRLQPFRSSNGSFQISKPRRSTGWNKFRSEQGRTVMRSTEAPGAC